MNPLKSVIRNLSCAALLTALTFALLSGSAHAAQDHASYSAAALFNQGNAFARAGKAGQAILMYERARLLVPNDTDVAANESIVRARAKLPEALSNPITRVFGFASPNVLAWLGSLGLVMIGISALLPWLFSGRRIGLYAALAAGLASLILAVGSAVYTWPLVNEAVVIVPEAPALVSPVNVAGTAFKLREGEIVTMNVEASDFALVQTHTGQTAWVARADLARVIPQANATTQSASRL